MNYRQIAAAVLVSFVIVPLVTLPFRAEVLTAVPVRPPTWGVPGMIATSTALILLWVWMWKNRPEEVF